MACPVCPTVGMFGGYIGGYFGIDTPEKTELQVASALITAGMIIVSIVALKYFFGISICDGNGDFSLRNVFQVGIISLLLGIIYSIAVNYFINLHWNEPHPALIPPQNETPHPCCCG